MIYNEKMEKMPLEEKRALQLERLQNIVAYSYENVPFYKKNLMKLLKT